jgi:hypothetical protein
MIADAALVAAMMAHDKDLRSCVQDSDRGSPAAVIAKDFDFQSLRLNSGERLTIALGKNMCGWQGQAARVRVFQNTSSGYRFAFSGFSLPEQFAAKPNGMLYTAAHETFNTIDQSTWFWNGSTYVFSPERSTVYCVGPERDNERPYELPVRFHTGESSTVLHGTAYQNCGQDYSFVARAGQRITVERLTPQPKNLRISIFLNFGDDDVADVDGASWTGTLAHTGKYVLSVSGTDPRGETQDLQPFAIRLTIR